MSERKRRRPARRKQTPDFPIQVSRLSHEGRGIASWGERMLFVDGALPGELVEVRLTQKSSKIAEAVTTRVHRPADNRHTPSCPHASTCGGCSLQHMPHTAQIAHKQATLQSLMVQEAVDLTDAVQLPPLLGPLSGYRRRARLGVRWVHAKQRVLVGFREKASNFIADIDACEVLDQRIGGDLHRLETVIAATSCPDRIPQIEVAAGDDTLAIIVRHLEPLSAEDHARFVDLGETTGWHVYLQPKGPDSVHRIWPMAGASGLTYRLGELGLEYQFEVTDFTQINAQINRQMILQALSLLEFNGSERVLDLFCGLGNFTLALATRAGSVTGVEVSQTMVDRVLQNARHNVLDNIAAHAFDLTESLADQSWANAPYDIVVVDPPRSGAKEVLEMLPLNGVTQLLYVSCNPATLARDAAILHTRGMKMIEYGVMDMFPQTAHVESMARFVQVKSHG